MWHLLWKYFSSIHVCLLVVSGLVKCDTNPIVGVPQAAELGDLPKEVTDKSIRPTQEFEGQNKSIKSRVRSTLMIWDAFAVDGIMNVVWKCVVL
ncbi:hypothetical protein ACFX15_033321 [Malus domestica]